jgi:hypothetical protein
MVTLTFEAFDVPDAFQVIFDGNVVIDTGYRGDPSYQSELDTEILSLPSPNPLVNNGITTITSPGSGSASFTKSTATQTAIVRVYAPITNTAWGFTLSCPSTTPSPSAVVLKANLDAKLPVHDDKRQ